MQKPFPKEGGKTQDTIEASMVMEKQLNLALLGLHAPGSARKDPISGFLFFFFFFRVCDQIYPRGPAGDQGP